MRKFYKNMAGRRFPIGNAYPKSAEIISLDAGLRMDGIPALTLWDLVIEVFHAVPNKIEQPKEELRGTPHPIQAHQRHSNSH